MATEQIETPSTGRFFVFCLAAALGALLVVMYAEVNAWFLLPLGIVLLAVLSLVDGYVRSRS